MNLLFDIPDNIQEVLDKNFKNEDILVAVPANVNDDNMYTSDMVIVTNIHIIYFDVSANYKSFKITEGTDYKCNVVVGNGFFEAKFNEEYIIIARFTMDHAPRYSAICKGLNQYLSGKPLHFELSEKDNKCPKCGRVLRHGSLICGRCIDKSDTIKKILSLIDRKYYKTIFICTLMVLIVSGLSLLEPYLLRLFVDEILIPQNKDYTKFTIYIVSIILIKIISTWINVWRGRKTSVLNNSLTNDLRIRVFEKIEKLSMNFLNKKKTGDLMHRVNHDTDRIRRFLQHEVMHLFSQIVTLVSVLIIIFTMSWQMAIFILLPVPLMIFVLMMFRNKTRRIYRIQWRLSSKANSILQDILSGMRIVKAFGKEKDEVRRYKKASRDFADRVIKNEKFWSTLHPVLVFIMEFGMYLIYLYGGYKIIGREFQVGEFLQFTQYAGAVYGPLGFMTRLPRSISNTMAAAGRIFEILDEDYEVYDESDTKNFEIKGEVKFDDVSFGYKSYLPVLNNISLHVKPGEMIGLVGHSGSGKSTLINLVMRLYDVESGSILIDGVDIRDISLKDYRKQIGVVLQETFLFTGTIRENIAYSKPDATDEEIIAAAKIANAHDFIVKFPDGYDTKIGERGQNLSGGEKQRIAIARAIIHDPKILILDEATSSLDTDTENLIQDALTKVIKNRTTFAIAHRLATLKNADRLLVLEKGNLVEMGTHEELLEKKGIYYKLVMAQKEMSKMDVI